MCSRAYLYYDFLTIKFKTMASTSETGHAKNVANFDALISIVTAYGTDYNPTKASIKPDALQTLSVIAKNSIDAVNAALPAYRNAVAAREAAFASLSKLITRVVNALKATDTTSQVDANAKTLARKIQGTRARSGKRVEEKNNVAETGKELIEISSSQMSYDNRLDNFDKLIKLLTSVTLYSPNETDLKVTTLLTLHNDLKTKNSAVLAVSAPLSNARILRNEILYKINTGLVDIAMDTKTYIKSLYGATSPRYRQVSRLEFHTVKS
jgi:hypothetical protein